jgi:4-amino-4-deoxy-L-arabinose transferase-like glycosyltransferase
MRSRIWIVTAIILTGAALRISGLNHDRFHPDEALFATLARLIVSGRDPLLSITHLLVDKPPLFYYTLAGSVALSGTSEMALRLPDLFASIIVVPLTFRLGWELWRSEVGTFIASTMLALSPFAIQFSPTVFSDPLMLAFLMGGCVSSVSGRWKSAGLWYGLALATKQSALFFAPVIVMLGVMHIVRGGSYVAGRRIAMGLGVLFGVLGLMVIWDVLRLPKESFWTSGLAFNDPGRLIRANELIPRAIQWGTMIGYFQGSPPWGIALWGAILSLPLVEAKRAPHSWEALNTLVLFNMVLAYGAFQWLVAFPVLDRYLLPIVPFALLLAGQAIDHGWLMIQSRLRLLSRFYLPLLTLLGGLSLVTALNASEGTYPLGGDHGAYDQIDSAAGYLMQKPVGSVIYADHLSWSLGYYLFDAYIYLASFEYPAELESDLRTFGNMPTQRYLVLHRRDSVEEIEPAVNRAGCEMSIDRMYANRDGDIMLWIYRVKCA